MARFGEYESVREVYQGGWAVVYTARAPGRAEEKTALKVMQLPVYLADDERIEQESALFLEAAETQRRAAAAGGLWAPVHASGRCDGGAWYATDYFERSAEKLVLRPRGLEPAELHRVIDAVVRGLLSLREIEGRPHGNLKPTNVLVGGRGDVSGERVVLADPLPTSRVKPGEDAIKDLKDLGDLVHQLVLHRPMRNVIDLPQMTPEWAALGRVGAGWLELCNALLAPTGTPPPLDEVAAAVADLSAKPTGGSSALVAGATPQAGAGTATPRPPSARPPSGTPAGSAADFSKSRPASHPASAPSGGEPSPEVAVATPVPKSSVASDPLLRSGPGLVPPSDGGSKAPGGTAQPPRAGTLGQWKQQEQAPPAGEGATKRTPLYLGAGAAALALVALGAWKFWPRPTPVTPPDPPPVVTPDPVAAGPDPRDGAYPAAEDAIKFAEETRRLVEATAGAAKLEGFAKAVAQFASLRDGLKQRRWPADKAQIDAELPALASGAANLRKTAQELRAESPNPLIKPIEAANSALEHATALIAIVGKGPSAAEVGTAADRVKALRDAAAQIKFDPRGDNTQATSYAAKLQEEVGALSAAMDKAFAGLADPRLVPEYASAAESIGEIDATSAALADFKKSNPGAAKAIDALARDSADLKARRDAIDPAKVPWTLEAVKPVREGAEAVVKNTEATLARARQLWRDAAPDPREDARKAAAPVLGEASLSEQGAAGLLASIKSSAALDETRRAAAVTSIETALQSLIRERDALKSAIESSSVPAWEVGAVAKAKEQTAALASLSEKARSAGAELKKAIDTNKGVVEAALVEYRKQLVQRAATMHAAIESGVLPTEKLGDTPIQDRVNALEGDSEFNAIESEKPVADLRARLKTLGEIAARTGAGPLLADLRDAAQRGRLAEGRLALQRLASKELAWTPAGGKELTDLAGAVAQLREVKSKDGSPAIGDVVASGTTLWRAFVERLNFAQEPDVKAALEVRPAIGIGPSDMGTLSGRVRYNFLLDDLRRALPGADEAGARDALQKFEAGLRALGDAAPKGAADALKALRAVDSTDAAPPPPPKPDYARLGPGLAGWTAREVDKGNVLTVTYTKGPLSLEFAQVGDTMIATTETSVAVFMQILEDEAEKAGTGSVMAQLPNPFRGASSWEWSAGAAPRPKLVEPDGAARKWSRGWLLSDPKKPTNIFPGALAVNPPDGGMPAQQISAPAACYLALSLGSRLPSSEEWQAALRLETEKSGARPGANLRDRTWESAHNAARAAKQAENKDEGWWFDEGIFVPGQVQGVAMGEQAARAADEDDGSLWFEPVDKDRGTLFHHLLGNVAEFVYDAPADLEARIEEMKKGTKPPPSAMLDLLTNAQSRKNLKVIGGSALSPKQVELETAQPLDRSVTKSSPATSAKSDVGFRLAFSSKAVPKGPEPLATRLLAAAKSIDFVPAP